MELGHGPDQQSEAKINRVVGVEVEVTGQRDGVVVEGLRELGVPLNLKTTKPTISI